jgi:RNA polymerase sigma-70 factor (ECF subfamily)
MDENNLLAERFKDYRGHLRAVAYRILGSLGEADDAVQEAWLRLSQADNSDVENLSVWLCCSSLAPSDDPRRRGRARAKDASCRIMKRVCSSARTCLSTSP